MEPNRLQPAKSSMARQHAGLPSATWYQRISPERDSRCLLGTGLRRRAGQLSPLGIHIINDNTIIYDSIIIYDMNGGRMALDTEKALVISHRGLQLLAKHALSKIEGAILWHLASTLPPTGAVVSLVALARELAASEIQVNRSMRRLCELGLVLRGHKVGVTFIYKLNPAHFRTMW